MTKEEVGALLEKKARAWERADAAAAVSYFAHDGVLISPDGRWQGHDELRRAAESYFMGWTDLKIDFTRVLLDGDQGAAEWIWRDVNRASGRRYTTDAGGIFVLRDNQVVYWREYWRRDPRPG